MAINRLEDLFKNKNTETDRASLQAMMERIAVIGNELYDMMDKGLTIEIDLPVKQHIIDINAKPEMRRLLITRPRISLKIDGSKGNI